MGMPEPAADTAKKGHSAAVHLIAFALVVAAPLLLLVGALLYRSVTLESEQIRQRIGQVLQALIADLDRDMDRRIAVLETLSTSPLLVAEDWPAFYAQAKQGLGSRAYLVLVAADGRQVVNTYVPYGEAPKMTGDPASLQRMKQDPRPVISDLFTSLVVRKPVYNISIPVMRGNELRYVMSSRPAARGSARPASEPEPAAELVGGDLGRQRRHHGAHARPGAPAGHGCSETSHASCSRKRSCGRRISTARTR